MRNHRPTGGQFAFLDEMGATMERIGLPRQAGRVLGLLLTAREDELTADAIASSLRISRASVSTTTALLVHVGLVDRLRKPGDRRDFFRTRPGNLTAMIRARIDAIARLRGLLDGALAVTPQSHAATRARLAGVRDFFAFFEREYPLLFLRWEEEKRKHAPAESGR